MVNPGENSATRAIVPVIGDIDIEPHNGIEFESHEFAYKFYQEYAKSMGFTTSIKNSRRSKKSKDFIDAKFACSRYGVTPELDSGSGSGSSRRPSVRKTDCKASMHVKRNKDGKWVIHEFVKDHNHELLPALAYHFRIHRNVKLAEKSNIDILHAVSERTKKMYVEMSRQSAGARNTGIVRNETVKGRRLVLEEGDAQTLLGLFMHIKKTSPMFYYAIDFNEEHELRNLFWVDAKGRSDYAYFSDVVSFDVTYLRIAEKMPLALFVGVNNHFQPILLGCALLADETRATFVWLMKTWLRAMNGKAPDVMVTEQHSALGDAVMEVFPKSRHCFPLWNILEKVPEKLDLVIKGHEKFLRKFNKCVFKSLREEDFEMRWWKMVSRFDLQEDEWVRSLYDDRKKWVPVFMAETFLAGMSTINRSESVSSFFDKYIYKKMTLKEFAKQYGSILQSRHEEEAIADFDTWHKQPALRSPSPWEKQMSTVYTHTIFRKFQVEVVGAIGCHPKLETGDNTSAIYRVEDCEKNETFTVSWDGSKSDVSCVCHSFEYRGLLCRHAMIVLQLCGVSSIPSHYILNRWTKDAKNDREKAGGMNKTLTRVHRYNELCKMGVELSEVGSLTRENYDIALRAFVEALKNCVDINNSNESVVELSGNAYDAQDGTVSGKLIKKKNAVKRRKVHVEQDAMMNEADHSLQQMESLNSDGITLNCFYGSHQNVQGLVQLNLMEPPHDSYYSQGLGQLHSIAPTHDEFFGSQHSVNGIGHLDFRPHTSFTYSLQDEHSLRPTQLHGDASRHTS